MTDELAPLVPDRLIHARRDVDAKNAFLTELRLNGFQARITREPADITADKDGERFYFEIKKTSRLDSYSGAATLTEWVAALDNPDRYFFVTAQVAGSAWIFHTYSGLEFMRFSTVPPFKVFFQIPVGDRRAKAPAYRATKSVRLTGQRVREMAELYRRWKDEGDGRPARDARELPSGETR